MERDPRGGEAKKASPVHSPSDSVIDDLLWTTYGINPRRQMEYKPLTNDDQKSMSKESHVDPKRKTSTEGDGGSGSSFHLTPGQILVSSLLLSVGVSLSGETISDDDKEVMKRALLRGTRVAELVAETAVMNAETQAKLVIPVYKPLTKDDLQSMSLQELKAAQARSVKRSDNLHVKMEMGMQYKEDRVAKLVAETAAMGGGGGGGVAEVHSKAQHGMHEDLCKRLAKHFTSLAAKKQKQAEK